MTDLTHLPDIGFVRLPTILNLIPVAPTTWWEHVRTGRFPPGIHLGPRVTVWRTEHIKELIEQPGAPLTERSWHTAQPS